MSEVSVHVVSFGIDGVGVHDDADLLLAEAGGQGGTFAMADQPAWLALGAGDFGDRGPSLRVAVAHPDGELLVSAVEPALRESLTAGAAAIRFHHTPLEARWLESVVRQDGCVAVDVSGPVPAFTPSGRHEHPLWMARFLEGVSNVAVDRAGVVVLLRPLSFEERPGLSALLELRRHLETMPYVAHTATREELRTSREGSSTAEVVDRQSVGGEFERHSEATWEERPPSKSAAGASPPGRVDDVKYSEMERRAVENSIERTEHGQTNEAFARRSVTTSSQHLALDRRRRAIAILNEGLRSGAWWASVRAFGPDVATARRVATLYWSCVQSAAPPSGREDYPHVLCVTRPARRPSAEGETSSWSWLRLTTAPLQTWRQAAEGGEAPRDKARSALYERLARHGIDVLAHIEGFLPNDEGFHERRREHMAAAFQQCPTLVVPNGREVLLTGRQLASAFQLPVAPNPRVEVVRGFGYCALPREEETVEPIRIGRYCPGGLDGARTERPPPHACLGRDDLTGHTLVTGATGAGKTTAVLALLRYLHEQEPGVRFAVLEGAKREYRQWRSALGIPKAGHFDLVHRHVRLHLFEHPLEVAPEAHLSQVASIFDATLDMPPPLPALMREGLDRAYAAYHTEEDPLVRALHPIRFWLMRAVLEVVQECGYRGEIGDNIDAALRTRIRSLGQGPSGSVLAGGDPWDDVAHQLTRQSALVELESIADEHSRSLVMALFVLYYRYALGGASQSLRNVLVLEEAHRIIGKRADGEGASERFFTDLLSEVRASGCGLVISDQSPARLIEDAMRNTNTKVLMRLVSGPDIRAAAAGAGLPAEAEADIPRLKAHQALLVRAGMRPALIRTDAEALFALPKDPEADGVSTADLRRHFVGEQQRARFYDRFLRLWARDPSNLTKVFRALQEELSLDPEVVETVGGRARHRLGLPEAGAWTDPSGPREALRRLPFVWLALYADAEMNARANPNAQPV